VNKISLSIAAAAALAITVATGAFAAELPSYQKAGLPISAVQLQVLGAENVSEQAPVVTMAASPAQLSVLTPRKIKTAAAH